MQKSRLLWRIYLYFLTAALAAVAITTGYAVRSLRHYHETQVSESLEMYARLVARDIAVHHDLETGKNDTDRLCREIGHLTGARITVILPDGRVAGDSDEDPATMDNHGSRPEIVDAFKDTTGTSSRFSDTLKQTLKYVAVPVKNDGKISAAVRASRPLAEIRWTRWIISRQLVFGGIGAALLFAGVALYLSRRISRPLEEMRKVAEQLAGGDLTARMSVSGDDEVGALARTLDHMASQLAERMATITRQQAEQQAVLSCMVEGVMAVDSGGRLLYLNDAAAQLLDSTPEQARGRSIQEAVRHHHLQEFIAATLRNTEISEGEITLLGIRERHVQLHGAPLEDTEGNPIGGVVVANDITKLKRLETVRSDFVANVSHELKTPITALKGCVETLSGDPPPDPADAARFIRMMSRHAERLESIVEDLLSLSRLEFNVAHDQVVRQMVPLCPVLGSAIRTFEKSAHEKKISLELDCPGNMAASVNSQLLEQAVGNLLDNAIKYSDPETYVTIHVSTTLDSIDIAVADQGPGIEKQYLSRIFERFYRVDRARSRMLGGTGLGLAIVRHICLAHDGNVTVDSTVGKGSTFTLHLPRR